MERVEHFDSLRYDLMTEWSEPFAACCLEFVIVVFLIVYVQCGVVPRLNQSVLNAESEGYQLFASVRELRYHKSVIK